MTISKSSQVVNNWNLSVSTSKNTLKKRSQSDRILASCKGWVFNCLMLIRHKIESLLMRCPTPLLLTVIWLFIFICDFLMMLDDSYNPFTGHLQDCLQPQEMLAMVAPISARRLKRNRKKQSAGDLPDICAAYARFSSNIQRDESIDQQLRECRDRAAANGHEIRSDLEFIDRATSGTKRNRSGLNKMLEAASNGEFNVLYIYSLSRLARESVISMPVLKKLVHVYGVRVICLTEGIDSAQGNWEMVATIFSAVHQQYLNDLRQQVLRGQIDALLGSFSVGDLRFGYKSVPIPGSENARAGRNAKPRMAYVIDEIEAEWVVQIFTWYVDEKKSISWIVKELNRLKVPKDNRCTTGEWHRSLVTEILQSPKYIGIWLWGELKNVRDPETGKITQVSRPEEEYSKWTRERPELAIIDDVTFDKAQKRLLENSEKWGKHRADDGTLCGSSSDCNGRTQVRPLSMLLKCAACGAPFYSSGKNFFCRSKNRGTCHVNQSVPVEFVETKVLNELGRLILEDEVWYNEVFQELSRQHQAYEDKIPAAIRQVELKLQAVEQKIKRLLDHIESGIESKDLDHRLQARVLERQELQGELHLLRSRQRGNIPTPTREWLRDQLEELGRSLVGESQIENTLLHALIPDGISMELVNLPKRKRGYFLARFKVCAGVAAQLLGGFSETDLDNSFAREITVDLRVLGEPDQQKEIAMQMFEAGHPCFEIAQKLGVGRARISAILDEAFAERGEQKPDGRSRRSTLSRKHQEAPLYQAISEQVMELYHQGALLSDIATKLSIDRNTVTSAVTYWHQHRDLPIPDGRTRRKSLENKASRP